MRVAIVLPICRCQRHPLQIASEFRGMKPEGRDLALEFLRALIMGPHWVPKESALAQFL